MNPTVLGVIGPGFLNQVPTLPTNIAQIPTSKAIRTPLKGPWGVLNCLSTQE